MDAPDASDRHITLDLLFRVFRGELPVSAITDRERDHLHALSPEHARAWEEFQAIVRRDAAQTAAGTDEARARYRRAEIEHRIAEHAAVADAEVEELLDLDPPERVRRVKRAYRRFRTPAFFERMIAVARTWLRLDPRESLRLLEIARAQLPRIDRRRHGGDLVEYCAVRVVVLRTRAALLLAERPAALGR